MNHKQSIYDDMEFNSPEFNQEYSNSQFKEKSGINPYVILAIVAIIIIATAVGTYHWTRKKYENKSISKLG